MKEDASSTQLKSNNERHSEFQSKYISDLRFTWESFTAQLRRAIKIATKPLEPGPSLSI